MTPKKSSKKPQPKAELEAVDGKPQENQNELFPVVGIGASAGGLEAFMQLLSHLPIDTGMAFVMIQHMLPAQKSLLSVILSRSTQMQVHEVTDGMAIAPNQIYVIPPNASMTIDRGMLNLQPRGTGRGVFMSVDTFLFSLAEERGNKAIGVILSGGDGDGAQGLKAIKAAGGITFAQSQGSAQVSSMPNTAVATGQVDFILTPEKIAQKIAEIALHPYIADRLSTESADSEDAIETKDAIATIYSLVRTATGVDFTHRKTRRKPLAFRHEEEVGSGFNRLQYFFVLVVL